MTLPTELDATAAFSLQVRTEVTAALAAYLACRDAATESRLRAATSSMCGEARAHRLTPEAMLIAVKAMYGGIPTVMAGFMDPRRDAYDRVILGCIKEYFGLTEPRTYTELLAKLREDLPQDSAEYIQ